MVILESIKDVEELKQILLMIQDANSYSYEVITYSKGEVKEEHLQNLNTNNIILTTNIAERGTDITTINEIELNRGIHIILGYFAFNIRVEEQALGRTARAGNRRSGEVVTNKSILNLSDNFLNDIDLYNY